MTKIGKASKASARSDKPRLSTSNYKDEGRLSRMEGEFNKKYGFVKGIPPRSTTNSAWEHDAIAENRPFMDDFPGNPADYSEDNLPYLRKEQALVAGVVHNPHGYKLSQMKGHLRMSGNPSAHRIGAKKK